MDFCDFLLENQTVLVKQWIDRAMSVYHADSLNFLTTQKDRFANPLGYKVESAIEHLYKSIRGVVDDEKMLPYLEQLLKMRAVQDHSASAAVAFIFDIKRLLRDRCRSEKYALADDDWWTFTCQVDELAMKTFELYSASRERLYLVRLQELKSGNFILTDGTNCPSAQLRRRQERQNEKEKVNLVNHDAR